MSKRSDKLVDLFFDDIPYSEETMRAKLRVRTRLAEKAEEMSFPALAEAYSSLEKMAILAGYTSADALRWSSASNVVDGKGAAKRFHICRWIAYGVAATSALTFTLLLRSICYAIFSDRLFFLTTALFLLCVGGIVALLLFLRKKERSLCGVMLDANAYYYLRASSDRYTKRLLNSCALFIAAGFIFEMTELDFYIFGNSKLAELAESVLSNYLFVAIPLFFLVKNTLILRVVRSSFSLPDKERFRVHLFGIVVLSTFYWALCISVMILFRRENAYSANYIIYALLLFFGCIALYDLTLRRRLCYRNLVLNKSRVAAVLIVGILFGAFLGMNRETWYTEPYINSVPVIGHGNAAIAYDDETGVYTLT